MVVVLATDVEGTVLNTSWDMLDASLNTPFNVTEKSAKRSSRSVADLSRPVMSCSAPVSYTHLTLPTNREV